MFGQDKLIKRIRDFIEKRIFPIECKVELIRAENCLRESHLKNQKECERCGGLFNKEKMKAVCKVMPEKIEPQTETWVETKRYCKNCAKALHL